MVALLRPGPPAERAYRRTVHIRQNSDRILSSMRPLARARATPVGKCGQSTGQRASARRKDPTGKAFGLEVYAAAQKPVPALCAAYADDHGRRAGFLPRCRTARD